MTMYLLMATRRVREGHHDAIGVRELSIDEFERLNTALSLAGLFNESLTLYEICQANAKDIEDFHDQVINTTGLNFASSHNMVVELNRLLLNYLSSFRTFVDHQETQLSKISTTEDNWISHFKTRCSEVYDSSFSYRFLWNLRNYVQHCGLPVGGVNIRTKNKAEGTEESEVSVYFKRDQLLENYKGWKKIVRTELAQQAERIAIFEHITNLRTCIDELAMTALEVHIHRLSEHWEFLVGVFNEVMAQYEGYVPVIGHFEKAENDIQPQKLSHLSVPLILKIQETWEKFNDEYNT